MPLESSGGPDYPEIDTITDFLATSTPDPTELRCQLDSHSPTGVSWTLLDGGLDLVIGRGSAAHFELALEELSDAAEQYSGRSTTNRRTQIDK